ncbi:hypothetical protein G7054_g10259 [Neopestalotiopsis clavispora]|nr:hypothetical protein G7054_g10259 [Neopestalotiopsis clavispora]
MRSLAESTRSSLMGPKVPVSQDADLCAGRSFFSDKVLVLQTGLMPYWSLEAQYLANVSSDPLADDPDSPWNTLRQDETLRAEILQDVQRLPDEPFYHEPRTQTLILDVLFIYCKLNPDVGGYRQGMHELLAPIVYVLEQDAINPNGEASEGSADLTMVEMLDANFIEHDAFTLFSKVMDRAKSFYETDENPKSIGRSTIVEKSQHIHEVLLYKVDPDLSTHLTTIEILPQIFLMIRWELLEADYSVALQLLLKYPSPQDPHGPHTFVDDALYLRDHLNPDGGSALVLKYTGRQPAPATASSRPTTPKPSGLDIKQTANGRKSPLSPSRFPTRFIQQPGGVEALFQGAAKGIFQRGEKLGVNQAVRDALGEIRRNVNEARSNIKAGRDLFAEPGPNTTAMQAVAALDRRNKQLAVMLEETLANLHALAASAMEDKKKHGEALQIAAAKIQFVKVYLEDSTVALPEVPPFAHDDDASIPLPADAEPGLPSDAAATATPTQSSGAVTSPAPEADQIATLPVIAEVEHAADTTPTIAEAAATAEADPLTTSQPAPPPVLQRPHPPIPTRSTLAQSSFAWMLEPDQSASSATGPKGSAFESSSLSSSSSSSKPKPAAKKHHKKSSDNADRQRTAFLFGDEEPGAGGEDGSGGKSALPEDIFGLQPMGGKTKERVRLWDD